MLIIVPYRDRAEHLIKFVEHYKDFDILVVEQSDGKLFNRGKLLNIGFNESKSPLVCFHDVDMLAEDLSHYKETIKEVFHFAGRASQFGYKMPYGTYIGGVTAFSELAFLKCNGFSNNYWGWGGEDDDLYNRTKLANIDVQFCDYRYQSLQHKIQPKTEQYIVNKQMVLSTSNTWQNDGLNSLRYEIIDDCENNRVRKIKVKI